MDGEELKCIVEFLKAVGRLKGLPRTGWLEAGVEEPESVAEHSYRTAIIAMVLADLQGLDAEKTMRMALLHDMAEGEMGDLTPEQKRRRGLAYSWEEEKVASHILSTLPETLAKRYRNVWREHIEGASLEAETVAQADKLEMMLQALEYEEAGFDSSRLDRFWRTRVEGGSASELAKAVTLMRRGRAMPSV